MLPTSLLLVCIGASICNAIQYNGYDGKPVTRQQMSYYIQRGAVDACVTNIEPCREDEFRRVDGSCNNLKHPVRGTHFVPLHNVLPVSFSEGYEPRKSVTGEHLPDERLVRLGLLLDGQTENADFTTSMTSFAVFASVDFMSIHDISNYLSFKTDCCVPGHENDEQCAPIMIGIDDPVYRYSGVTCLNLTKPLTYQYYGCTQDSTPSPIQNATAALDLSHIYNFQNKGDGVIRSFVGGMLETEERNGIVFPPSHTDESEKNFYCPLNKKDNDLCFKNYQNSQFSVHIYNVWFMRLHNFFAQKLAEVNPCWDDEMLFYVARDMNIAFYNEMYVQEWMTALLGQKNMRKFRLAGRNQGHRDMYDPNVYPYITVDFSYALRWFHTCQQGIIKLFKTDGTFVRDHPLTNLTLDTGAMAEGDNMEGFTQAMFRLPSGKIHHGADYELTHNGLPGVQKVFDVLSSDLKKGRLFGVAPYVDYLRYYFGARINSYDDLRRFVSDEMIGKLKRFYKHPKDIDLMAGLWSEELLPGGKIPQTLGHMLAEATLASIKGDRHWYERVERPHAFTREQLFEIRKASQALLLCSVGDKVTQIQRNAFFNISPKNPLVSCSKIPSIDFSAWADPACYGRFDRPDCPER